MESTVPSIALSGVTKFYVLARMPKFTKPWGCGGGRGDSDEYKVQPWGEN